MIWDNLSVHKRARGRQLIEAAGCQVRFLPAYSLDFNPIEQAFSQLKRRMRWDEARSLAAIFATAHAYLALTVEHARHYY